MNETGPKGRGEGYEACVDEAHPAGDFRTLSELLTNNSRNLSKEARLRRICAKAPFSFGPGADRFLFGKAKRKWGRISCGKPAQKTALPRCKNPQTITFSVDFQPFWL